MDEPYHSVGSAQPQELEFLCTPPSAEMGVAPSRKRARPPAPSLASPTGVQSIDAVRSLDNAGVDGCPSCAKLRRSFQSHWLRHFLYVPERTVSQPRTTSKPSPTPTPSSAVTRPMPTPTTLRRSRSVLRRSPRPESMSRTDSPSPDGWPRHPSPTPEA